MCAKKHFIAKSSHHALEHKQTVEVLSSFAIILFGKGIKVDQASLEGKQPVHSMVEME